MIDWLLDDRGRADWRWITTSALALYAAIISTYREYTARQERSHNVDVHFSPNMVVMLTGHMVPHVQVRVENHGKLELTFDSNAVSLEWRNSDGTRLLFWDDKISSVMIWPHRLVNGASYYVMAKTEPLREVLAKRGLPEDVQIRAVVSDAIGRQFFSNWASLPLRGEG